MLKSVEDIDATKKRLRIEIPQEMIENEIRQSLEKLRQSVRIPGFRQGKAPVTLIEKRYGKGVEAEVLEKIIPEQLGNAIREAAISPVTMPTLDEEFDYKRNSPLNLSVTVEIMPKVENLRYDNLTVKELPVEVTESDIEDTINSLRERKAVYEVAEKEAELDDFVSFEFEDAQFEGGDDPNAKEAVKKLGNEIFPADFMEKVTGKKKGDIVEFSKTFDELLSKELAGKSAVIKVKITEVKRKILPGMDDDFAKEMGYGDVAELREKVKEKIHGAKSSQIRRLQKAEIVSKLLDGHKVEVPEVLLRREMESLMMQKGAGEERGEGEAESPAAAPSDEKELEAKVKEKAMKNVQASILVDAIGHEMGIAVSDEEVTERLGEMAKSISATPEALRNFYEQRGSMDSLKQSIFEDKVLDKLLAGAGVEKENQST